MAFKALETHVAALGGVRNVDGGPLKPIDEAAQQELSGLIQAPLPASLRWWFSTFGGGIRFVEPVVYTHPREGVETVLDYFLDAAEIRQTLDDFEGSMAAHRIPIHDDLCDLLIVDPDGSVYEHIHDAPLDRNEHRIADSFEAFVLMLRRGQ